MPIISNWRAHCTNFDSSLWRLGFAFFAGVVMGWAAVYYARELIILGLDHPIPKHASISPPAGLLSVACVVPLEEILFRAIILATLVLGLRRVFAQSALSNGAVPVWFANVLQALMFAATHLAAGAGVLDGHAWYVRLPLMSQTWTGLAMGAIAARYGLESAIVCHLAFDVSAVALW